MPRTDDGGIGDVTVIGWEPEPTELTSEQEDERLSDQQ